MDELILLKPDETLLDEINAYRNAMIAANSSMDGTGSLRRHEAAQWLVHARSLMSEEICPPKWVPATQFVCVRKSDSRIVGMIDLRHRFNEFLAEYAGNIGYSVRPDERRKGYARWMLANVLPEARKLGLTRVLVTCEDNNEASRRAIEANGGRFERTTYLESEQALLRRYWIDL